jgi:ankyrin repeat protein
MCLRGAHYRVATSQGSTPLGIAVSNRKHYAVSMLLEKGVDPDAVEHGAAPIFAACRTGDLDTVKVCRSSVTPGTF